MQLIEEARRFSNPEQRRSLPFGAILKWETIGALADALEQQVTARGEAERVMKIAKDALTASRRFADMEALKQGPLATLAAAARNHCDVALAQLVEAREEARNRQSNWATARSYDECNQCQRAYLVIAGVAKCESCGSTDLSRWYAVKDIDKPTENSEPVHDWPWALEQMKAQKHVRRYAWDRQTFLYLHPYQGQIFGRRILLSNVAGRHNWQPYDDDFEATDWQLIEDMATGESEANDEHR